MKTIPFHGTILVSIPALHCNNSFTRSPPLIPLAHNRHLSFKAQLIEIDLGSSFSATSNDDSGEIESLSMKKLEEMIHLIVVQKSTPDWLPFVPGSSFKVPQRRRSNSIVDLVSKLANQLTGEETLSLTTLRGWPYSSLLQEGQDVLKMDAEMKMLKENGEQVEIRVEVLPDSENTSQPEDEER